jgi:glycosyltransferase involved in cell wall biosynthesis
MAQLMQQCGKDMPHEIHIGNDGIVSWLHIEPGKTPVWWLKDGVKTVGYNRLVHLVRHPLKVIASSQTLHEDSLAYISEITGKNLGIHWTIENAMKTWVAWNELIESKNPQYFLRIEDINWQWPKFREFMRIPSNDMPKIPKNVNARKHGDLTWQDLKNTNKKLYKQVRDMAKRYGYSVIDAEVEPAKIAVAMIVRDEEKNLERCLNSVQYIADEIIIVDTGSVDNTIKIAESFGARIINSPWRDDFSFHRNESFQAVSPDIEWILRIDADEELFLLSEPKKFKQSFAQIPNEVSACRCKMEDMRGAHHCMDFMQMHFFRNGRVTWENRKHNFPRFDGPVYQQHLCKTRHYGYDITTEDRQKKRDRDINLIELTKKDKEAAGEKYYKYHFYLSQIYGQYDGDLELSLEHAMKYIEAEKDNEGFNPSIYMTAYNQLEMLGRPDEALDIVHEALSRYPDDLDLNWVKCRLSTKSGNHADMVEASNRYVEAWNMAENNPASNDGRFQYFHNKACLNYVLHKLVVNHFYQGISLARQFYKFLEDIPEEPRKALKNDMDTDLDKIGVDLGEAPEITAN